MNRLLVRLYVVGSIVVFLAVTAFFFYDLSETKRENEFKTSQAFDTLADSIALSWSEHPISIAGERAIATIETAPFPLVVSVYSFDIGIDYLWAVDDQFIQGNIDTAAPSPPIIRTNELVHQQYSRSFRLPDGQRRIVTAVYPVLDTASIYPTLRVTFIIVLAFLSVVLIVAIVHAIGNGTSRTPKKTQQKPTSQHRTGEKEAAGSRSPSSPTSTPTTREEEVAIEIATGNYKTTSGLVPEEGLNRRITLELERAAFHEQDLSVAMFHFNTGTRGDEMYRRNASAILAFFSFEDLCFEKGDHDVVVVFPATTLSDTLGQLERFQRYYWEERNNWTTPEADFVVGVSARNGRLVEGDRVVRECSIALEKAKTTSGRIMGFQPDPQRYRTYLLET